MTYLKCVFEKYKTQLAWFFWILAAMIVFLSHAISNHIFLVPAIACGFYLIMIALKAKALNKRNAYAINGIHKNIPNNDKLGETDYQPSNFVRYVLIVQALSWYIVLASMAFTVSISIVLWLFGITVALNGVLYAILVIIFSSMFEHIDSKFGHREFYV